MGTNAIAYHSTLRALLSYQGGKINSPESQFADIIRYSVSGTVPYAQYYEAGRLWGSKPNEGVIEDAMRFALATDANILAQLARVAKSVEARIEVFNLFNKAGALGVETTVSKTEDGKIVAERQPIISSIDDLPACREATLIAAHLSILGNPEQRLRTRRLSEIGRFLNQQRNMIYIAVCVLEENINASMPEVAIKMNAAQSTLRKALQLYNLTFDTLHQACRLSLLIENLQTGLPLQEIAVKSGFADLSHMSKSVTRASGINTRDFLKRI